MNPRTKSQDIRDLSQKRYSRARGRAWPAAFRAKQLIEWVFEKNVCSFDDMTNLPKAFREQLKEAFAFDTPTELTKASFKDGSRKYLLEYHDGVSVETVGMPRRNKLSVCVSTQAGCGMGCAFCATGLNGLKRSLTAQEIVDRYFMYPTTLGSAPRASSSWARANHLPTTTRFSRRCESSTTPMASVSVLVTSPSLPVALFPVFANLRHPRAVHACCFTAFRHPVDAQ